MGKKYKGKTCVYCLAPNSSEDGDHVISRQFFLTDKRANLPKVPACKSCNNLKSELEHYLTAVMPFGGRHADSTATLNTMVPQRLEKNKKLHAVLADNVSEEVVSIGGNPPSQSMTLPLDTDKLLSLFQLIARGLAYSHWKIHLPADCLVEAFFIRPGAQDIFNKLMPNGPLTVDVNLGDGVFVYRGSQAAQAPHLTLWKMSLYGAAIGGDGDAPDEIVHHAYVLSAPKNMSVGRKIIDAIKGNR